MLAVYENRKVLTTKIIDWAENVTASLLPFVPGSAFGVLTMHFVTKKTYRKHNSAAVLYMNCAAQRNTTWCYK